MAVNRLADLPYDRVNPRTNRRELVTGEVGVTQAVVFTLGCAVVFVAACWGLNRLCLLLAPVALVWGAFYSLTKRFTWLSHFVLGSVLGLAPVAGWLAVDPVFAVPAVLFGCGVTCWAGGFDVLYACQDVDFDRAQGLYSMGLECTAHQGIHYWADAYILEILDPTTLTPVAPGEVGEMVVTSLCKEAVPLIRYRTRDLTRLIPGDCAWPNGPGTARR